MVKAFLSLGSNIGGRKMNLDRAVGMIGRLPGTNLLKVSSYIETKPVGYTDQPDFLNAVAMIETSLAPRELLDELLKIELQMGRKRTIRWGPRVIDIDILLYNNEQINEEGLQVPHPRMMERGFVLKPLAEIEPDLMLPNGITAKEAAKQVTDQESAKG